MESENELAKKLKDIINKQLKSLKELYETKYDAGQYAACGKIAAQSGTLNWVIDQINIIQTKSIKKGRDVENAK